MNEFVAFTTIAAVAVAGLLGLPMWTIPLAALSLFAVSPARGIRALRGLQTLDAGDQIAVLGLVAGSYLNGLLVCSAGYALGWAYAYLFPMPI